MGSINRVSPQSPWHLHTNGLYSILKQRGTAALREVGSRMGFWPAYNMVASHFRADYQSFTNDKAASTVSTNVP